MSNTKVLAIKSERNGKNSEIINTSKSLNIVKEKLTDLESRINNIIKSEEKNKPKIKLKQFIDKYKKQAIQDEKVEKDKELFSYMIKKVNPQESDTKIERFYEGNVSKKIERETLEDIENHKHHYDKVKLKIHLDNEVARIEKKEELKVINEKLSNSLDYSLNYINIKNSQKKSEEMSPIEIKAAKEEVLKKKNFRMKEFARVIQDGMRPPVSEEKHLELEESIKKLYDKTVKKHVRKTRAVVLKPIENKNKYSWELKLDKVEYKDPFNPPVPIPKAASPVTVKQPLSKRPDYLTENRQIKEMLSLQNPEIKEQKERIKNKLFEKMLEADTNPANNQVNSKSAAHLVHNVENLKMQSKLLEEQAKMKQQLLKNSGGSKINPELSKDVSNLLINSIQAKLAILNKINN